MDGRWSDVRLAKDAVRMRMWAMLQEACVVPPPGPRGRIPDFIGAELAASRLAELPEWKRARVVKINPDSAQLPVRVRALADGKLVFMAVPKLAMDHPFVCLDPKRLSLPPEVAARKNDAVRVGRAVGVREMPRMDLVVAGSLAVCRNGARLGKGAGYTDIELGLLMDESRIDATTPVATTVHDLQLVEEVLPQSRYDFEVSIIVTPTTVLRVADPRPSPGIVWSDIDPSQIASIPALARPEP